MITLALLAGGRSTRMGRDKLLLPLAGRTMLQHLVEVGVAAGLPVIVCGRPAPAEWSLPAVRFLGDAQPDEGPLRGLEAALAVADEVLLLAGDLPWVTTADLLWLCRQSAAEHGVATTIAGQLQPLFSRYAATCRPLLAAELAAGRRSPRAVLGAGNFAQVEVPAAMASRLLDVDFPADFPADFPVDFPADFPVDFAADRQRLIGP